MDADMILEQTKDLSLTELGHLITVLEKALAEKSAMVKKQRCRTKASKYISVMKELTGQDIMSDRSSFNAAMRYIVIERLSTEGFGEVLIGEAMHLDHSTVHFAKKRVADMLSNPHFYPDELSIRELFINRI